MPLVIADRVRETTLTSGTDPIALAGPYLGFQAFSVIGNGNTTYYVIIDAQNGAWEVGVGTYASAGNTLARTTVLASSNAGSLVNFGAGTKDVILTQPAGRSVLVQQGGAGLLTGTAAFTANGIPYANSNSTLTTGSALTFDGANLGVGTSSPVAIGGHTGVLTLYGSNATALVLQDAVGRRDIRFNDNKVAITDSSGLEYLALDASGNLQVQTGAIVQWAPAPAAISTTATLTNANIQGQIINTTGTSYTVTMPLGTTLETLVPWAATNLGYDFSVINTASGTITMAVNTGVTSLGGLTIATGVSAQFRIRRTAANTFILYRLS